jgi:hypothetical protein
MHSFPPALKRTTAPPGNYNKAIKDRLQSNVNNIKVVIYVTLMFRSNVQAKQKRKYNNNKKTHNPGRWNTQSIQAFSATSVLLDR